MEPWSVLQLGGECFRVSIYFESGLDFHGFAVRWVACLHVLGSEGVGPRMFRQAIQNDCELVCRCAEPSQRRVLLIRLVDQNGVP